MGPVPQVALRQSLKGLREARSTAVLRIRLLRGWLSRVPATAPKLLKKGRARSY